jgi:hypothetical protein
MATLLGPGLLAPVRAVQLALDVFHSALDIIGVGIHVLLLGVLNNIDPETCARRLSNDAPAFGAALTSRHGYTSVNTTLLQI